MACRITEIVLDSDNPEALARFWCEVLDYEIVTEEDGVLEIGREGNYPTIILEPAGESKRQKLRLHIDVNATDRDQDAELERLLAIGAKQVDVGQHDVDWYVLADPEGNEFCLLKSRVED
ncbi:VOC family protein [Saccharothrix xinjiangensis]|uniref:VOC family protein n=1 Tax=Saccharothrix xinjiangensis TaxID=204798 RepID=A0ABV9Y0E3_9PSEU